MEIFLQSFLGLKAGLDAWFTLWVAYVENAVDVAADMIKEQV